MCKTCNGTGGINIEHTWGWESHPCPNSDCTVNERLREELMRTVDQMLIELRGRESA